MNNNVLKELVRDFPEAIEILELDTMTHKLLNY